MSIAIKHQPVLISTAELRKRIHVHNYIDSHESASRFKTGVLDVELLKAGLVHVPLCLDSCAVVGITYAARTVSNLTHKPEAVFNAYDAKGEFIGSYFSSMFKSLSITR